MILASAGTGKTHALTNRFLKLLALGEEPERILATTFTRKAAGEILRKVVSRLAEGGLDDAHARELSEQVEVAGIDAARWRAVLGRLARSLDRLSVGTIDAFFGRLASGFGLRLGGRERRIIDEDEDAELRAEAVSMVMRDGDRAELLDLLRRRSPGLAPRSVHADMLEAVDSAYRHALMTPVSAWGALHVPAPLGASVVEAAVAGVRAMKVPTTKAGKADARWSKARDAVLECLGEEDWDSFIEKGLGAKVLAGEPVYYGTPIDEEAQRALGVLLRHAAGVLLAPLPARTLATRRMLDRYDGAYRSLKESRGLCTFDDVPRLLLEHGAMGTLDEVYYRLDARLHHVLLDEFQDTSVAQWRLLEPLAEEIVSREDERSLLCVGDVKQSLYAWRQAEPELLRSLPGRWPHVRSIELVKSWRSSAVIIEAVNTVMGTLASNPALGGPRGRAGTRAAVDRWGEMFRAHSTARELAGYCRVSVSPEGDGPTVCRDAAIRAGAARIRELRRACPGRSIGVLFRSRARIAEMKLELARGTDPIAASEEGGNPLADSPAVAACLSMLLLADHPGHSAALFHVAMSPLGEVAGVRFPGKFEAVCEAAARVRRRLLAEGYAGVLEEWFRGIAPSCSARDARRMDQLVSLAARFDERSREDPCTRPGAFVEFVRRQRVEDPSAAPVRLMTMHAAKGLEFDIVVLPWLDEPVAGTSPAVLEDRDPRDPLAESQVVSLCPRQSHLALHPELARMFEQWRGRQTLEELCVLYVALTRAVHAMEIFVPPAKQGVSESDGSTVSFARIIRGCVADRAAVAGEVLWEIGDAAWNERAPARPGAPAAIAKGTPVVRLNLESAARTRHLPRASPADEEAPAQARRGPARAWPSLDDAERERARRRGILFHAWAEQIEWLDEAGGAAFDVATTPGGVGSIDPLMLGSLAREFRTLLDAPEIRALLGRPAGGVEVRRELAFVRAQEGRAEVLVGRIDRLHVIRGPRGEVERAEVIDFKTDTLEDATERGVDRAAGGYRAQMGHYRRAAAALVGCGEEKVGVSLVFLTHGRVVRV